MTSSSPYSCYEMSLNYHLKFVPIPPSHRWNDDLRWPLSFPSGSSRVTLIPIFLGTLSSYLGIPQLGRHSGVSSLSSCLVFPLHILLCSHVDTRVALFLNPTYVYHLYSWWSCVLLLGIWPCIKGNMCNLNKYHNIKLI